MISKFVDFEIWAWCLNPKVSVSICWNEKGIALMAACLGSSHGNRNFISLSSSTMSSLINVSNSSDLMVCFAIEAESLSPLESNNGGKTS